MTDDDRIISIETKLAYQEDTIQALNDVVCQQDKRIEQLESTCRILIDQLSASDDPSASDNPQDEVPPHY
jgi:SlyX protein